MWHDDNDDIMKLYELLEEHEFNYLPSNCLLLLRLYFMAHWK